MEVEGGSARPEGVVAAATTTGNDAQRRRRQGEPGRCRGGTAAPNDAAGAPARWRKSRGRWWRTLPRRVERRRRAGRAARAVGRADQVVMVVLFLIVRV